MPVGITRAQEWAEESTGGRGPGLQGSPPFPGGPQWPLSCRGAGCDAAWMESGRVLGYACPGTAEAQEEVGASRLTSGLARGRGIKLVPGWSSRGWEPQGSERGTWAALFSSQRTC